MSVQAHNMYHTVKSAIHARSLKQWAGPSLHFQAVEVTVTNPKVLWVGCYQKAELS